MFWNSKSHIRATVLVLLDHQRLLWQWWVSEALLAVMIWRPSSLLNGGGLHVYITTNSCICLWDLSFKALRSGEVSKTLQLTAGVTQGSVFGPPLFSTCNVSESCHDFSCYADNRGSFQFNKPKISASISGNLSDILDWIQERHLQLNLPKVNNTTASQESCYRIWHLAELYKPHLSVQIHALWYQENQNLLDRLCCAGPLL